MSIRAIADGKTFNNVKKITASDGTTTKEVDLSEVGTIPTPTATRIIDQNGLGIDVMNYARVDVDVPSSGATINNQNKTVDPTESRQTIDADSGYTGLGTVTINPISSTYVGSGVAKKSSTDLTASGATVTVPAGYYASQATKSVSTATLATPSASKGTVSNNKVSVTPSITQSSGYVTGATKSGTAVTVSASELVSGNKSITSNGTNIDVTNYKTVSVNVPTSSGTDTSDATATAKDIVNGKTAYVNGTKVTGNIRKIHGDNGYESTSELNYASQYGDYISINGFLNSPNEIICIERDEDYPNFSTLIPKDKFGNATAADVANGKTFTSASGLKITGTYSGSSGTDTTIASGGATSSDIASGKKAYVNGELITGNVQVKGEYIQYRINDASPGSEGDNFYLYNSNPSDILLRKNAVVYLETPRINFGNATAADVAKGKTFTSADGLRIVGTKEDQTSLEKTGYIDRKQANPPSSATSQTFTGMKGEPDWFVYTVAASSLPTASGYSRCVNVIYDGTNLVGSALGTLGTYSTSYFTKSYSGTSLTVGTTGSSTGGYVHNSSASEGYRLLYGYGGAHVNKTYTLNTGNSLSFTGINKKPDWFCLYVAQSFNASGDTVVDVVYDGKNVYGNYAASNSVKYATDFTYTYSGTTLTINSNSSSSFNVDDSGYDLIYGYANESEDSGSGDSGGGGSSSSDFYSGTFTGTGTKADQVEINCGFQPTGFTIVSNTTMSAANNISMVSATKVGTTKYTGCVGYRGSYGSTITTSAFVNASIPTSQVTVTFGTNSLTIKPGTNYAFQNSAYTVHAWK